MNEDADGVSVEWDELDETQIGITIYVTPDFRQLAHWPAAVGRIVERAFQRWADERNPQSDINVARRMLANEVAPE